MSGHENDPQRGGPIAQLKGATRDAWSSGPFAFFVFCLLGILPLLGLAYIVIKAVLGVVGVQLPDVQTSVG